MKIKKISLSGNGLYKGHLDRRIFIPARQFVARLYESNNARNPIFDIRRNRASFSCMDSGEGVSKPETPLTGDMKGSILHTLGSAPYSWVKEVKNGEATPEDIEEIITLLQKMKVGGKAIGNLDYILEVRSDFQKRLKKIEEELETPHEYELRKYIVDLERACDANPSSKSLDYTEAVRKYLEATKQFKISYGSAFVLFNKIWGAEGMFPTKR